VLITRPNRLASHLGARVAPQRCPILRAGMDNIAQIRKRTRRDAQTHGNQKEASSGGNVVLVRGVGYSLRSQVETVSS
jgi:hypothetical protein